MSHHDTHTVFVGNLADRLTETELRAFLEERCGEVRSVKWRTPVEGKCRCATVAFYRTESAAAAIRCHWTPLHGRPLNIDYTKAILPLPDHSGSYRIHVIVLDSDVGSLRLHDEFNRVGRISAIEWKNDEATISYYEPLPPVDQVMRLVEPLAMNALWKIV